MLKENPPPRQSQSALRRRVAMGLDAPPASPSPPDEEDIEYLFEDTDEPESDSDS